MSSAVLAEWVASVAEPALADVNGTLEQLVDQELDRQLRTLVDERLAIRNVNTGDDATRWPKRTPR